MKAKSMRSVVEELRGKSPELDRRINETRQRRELALALHRLRRSCGMTQVQVAEVMGRDQAHISRMESVTGPFPDAASIAAYAHACQSSAGYVFVTGGKRPEQVFAVPLGGEEESEMLAEALLARNVKIAGES